MTIASPMLHALGYAADLSLGLAHHLARGAAADALDRALGLLARTLPTRTIATNAGDPYLGRTYLLGRRGTGFPKDLRTLLGQINGAAYLHRFHRGDLEPEHHSHPWEWAVSIVLTGGYTEELVEADGTITTRSRPPGSIGVVTAPTFHRVAELHAPHVWTLFITGPRTPGSRWYFRRLDGEIVPHAKFIAEREAERALEQQIGPQPLGYRFRAWNGEVAIETPAQYFIGVLCADGSAERNGEVVTAEQQAEHADAWSYARALQRVSPGADPATVRRAIKRNVDRWVARGWWRDGEGPVAQPVLLMQDADDPSRFHVHAAPDLEAVSDRTIGAPADIPSSRPTVVETGTPDDANRPSMNVVGPEGVSSALANAGLHTYGTERGDLVRVVKPALAGTVGGEHIMVKPAPIGAVGRVVYSPDGWGIPFLIKGESTCIGHASEVEPVPESPESRRAQAERDPADPRRGELGVDVADTINRQFADAEARASFDAPVVHAPGATLTGRYEQAEPVPTGVTLEWRANGGLGRLTFCTATDAIAYARGAGLGGYYAILPLAVEGYRFEVHSRPVVIRKGGDYVGSVMPRGLAVRHGARVDGTGHHAKAWAYARWLRATVDAERPQGGGDR